MPENQILAPTLLPQFDTLLRVYEEEAERKLSPKPLATVSVNVAVSAAAFLYEKIRNAIEYREEHLLRRAAIERILKRIFFSKSKPEHTADTLIRELIWAHYLENDALPHTKIDEVTGIITKYTFLWTEFLATKTSSQTKPVFDLILSLVSCEVEENLTSPRKRNALVRFMYERADPFIKAPADISPAEREIFIKNAIHRTLVKSDRALLTYNTFLAFFPRWSSAQEPDIKQLAQELENVRQKIGRFSKNPYANKLYFYFKKTVAPFLVLEEILEREPLAVRKSMENPTTFLHKAKETCVSKYQKTKARLNRAAIRSIIYIFLTKVLIAVLLESPYELITHRTNYVALAVNVLFPPILMFLVIRTISVPEEENTQRLLSYLKSIVYSVPGESIFNRLGKQVYSKNARIVFGFFYSFAFVVSFGLILWVLGRLHFNPVSAIIFILFMTLVSFFGLIIRQSVQELRVIGEKGNLLTPLIDFLWFPILQTGHWLSSEFSKLNFMTFIFDFIIEAPLKTIIQIIEDWFNFLRTKQDEIV